MFFSGWLTQMGISIVLPILAKTGTVVPADVVVAAVVGAFTVLAAMITLNPWLQMVRPRGVSKVLLMLTGVVLLCVLPMPSYSRTKPKRLMVQVRGRMALCAPLLWSNRPHT